MFFEKLFPSVVKLEKEEEFLTLQQGNMSMGHYTAKFEELSQFYELASYTLNDQWKIKRYKNGLRVDIVQSLSSFACTIYSSLVQQAYVAKGDLKKLYADRREFWLGRKSTRSSNSSMGPKGNINKGKQVQNSETPKFGARAKYGRFHKGECRLGSSQCYYCKKEAHYAKHCPESKKKKQFESTTTTQGRVYTLLKGTRSLFNKCVLIVFIYL